MKKNNLKAATNSEVGLEVVINYMNEAFLMLDQEYRIIFLNTKAEEFLDQKRDAVLEKFIWEIFPFNLVPMLPGSLTKDLLQKGQISHDFLSPVSHRWFKITAYVSFDNIVILLSDIHEKLALEKLQQSERNLRFMLDTLPHIAYIATPEGEDTYLNYRWTEYSGKTQEEGLGVGWKEIVWPSDLKKLMSLWKMRVKKGKPFSSQYRLRNSEGEYRWHLAHMVPLKDENGKVILWSGTATDIHEQKLIEKELEERKHFITEVTEATPDLICIYNLPLKKFTYVNSQISLYLGYSPHELINFSQKEIQQRIHPADWTSYINYHTTFFNASDEEIREIEYRAKDNEGEWKWLWSRGKVFQRDEGGQVVEFIAVTQEVTAKKEAEEKDRQNKLLKDLIEKKDEFMSIASHELKTPITTMKASLQIINRLLEKQEDEKMLSVYIKKANQQINKLTTLISQLMDNAGIQAEKLRFKISSFNIQEIIDDCLAHTYSHRHKIKVVNELKEPIEGDKNRLEQVLMNFLTNAIKYSPRADEVILKVTPEGRFVKVSVTDFGIGIPDSKIDRVFDRFFRVDEHSVEYSGLGLGLFIASEIIQRHNGTCGVTSEEGKGSTFWFKIPLKR